MILWRLVTRELGRDVATGKEARATYKVGTQYRSGAHPRQGPARRADAFRRLTPLFQGLSRITVGAKCRNS